MSVDLGKVLRIQGAIRAALESVTADQAAVGADALLSAYGRLWEQAVVALSGTELQAEFLDMFPEKVDGARPANRHDLFGQAAAFNTARGQLGQMAGWLEGVVREAQIRMEAEEYAALRVRQERPLGFGQGEAAG